MERRVVGRRVLVGGIGGLALGSLAGCGGSPPPQARPTGGSSPGGGSPSRTRVPSVPPLPTATPWVANPGEIEPDVKRRATELIEVVAGWPAGQQGAAAAGTRLAAAGFDTGLLRGATPLLTDDQQAVVEVIDAQYGGLRNDSASVLVAFRRWSRTADGQVRAGGSTIDVRLVRARPRWRVTEIRPAEPGPPMANPPAPGPTVLASDRIRLPPAAGADIRSGQVHPSVLRALDTLSENYVLDVSVVRSGHPIFVFGTNRRSDHPRGRAVDIWAINGRRVVDPDTPPDLVDNFMRRGARLGSYNVGGPRQLDGPAFFSDNTHHDHVHLGFRA